MGAQTNTEARPRPGRWTRRVLTTLAIALVAVGAIVLAPQSIHVDETESGAAALADDVRDLIADNAGYQAVHVTVVDDGIATHAGVGASTTGEPIKADDLIELGSITKTFVGLLVADALARGELSREDTLSGFFPRLQDTLAGSITVEELATHHSGLPSMVGAGNALMNAGAVLNVDLLSGSQREDLLSDVAQVATLDQRGSYVYSNAGAALLGHAVTRAAGYDSWTELVEDRLLTPLGMDATVFAETPEDIPSDVVRGVRPGGTMTVQGSSAATSPAGCCTWTTPADMARFASAILDGSAPGIADAAQPLANAEGGDIGLLWFTDLDDTGRIWSHGGATDGFFTMLLVMPDADRAVFGVANSAYPVDALARNLAFQTSDHVQQWMAPLAMVSSALWIATFALLVAAAIFARTRATIIAASALFVVGTMFWRIHGPWADVPGWLWILGLALGGSVALIGFRRRRMRTWFWARSPWVQATVTGALVLLAIASVIWVIAQL